MRRVRTHRFAAVLLAVAAAIVALAGDLPSAAADSGTLYTWVGSSQNPLADNHSWTDPLNWSPEGVPGDGDSVSIAPPNSEDCKANVDNVPTVTLQDFSFSIADQCGANINGGTITVTGTMMWDSGRINVPLVLATGATATVNGGGLESVAPELANDMTVNGVLNLSGDLWMEPPTQLIIASTGTMVASFASIKSPEWDCCMNPAKVVNDGSLTLTDGNLYIEYVEFDQDAAVELDGGGFLVTVGGPVKLNDGGSYSTSTEGGSWIISTNATLSGTQTLDPGIHLLLGDPFAGTGPGTLGGDGTFNGSGELDWTEGTIQGNLTIGHGVTLVADPVPDGDGGLFLGSGAQNDPPATLTDHGTILVMAQDITMRHQATLQVAQNGHMRIYLYRTISADACCDAPDQIVNAGHVVAYVNNGSARPTAETAPVTFDGVGYVDDGGTTVLDKHADLVLTGGAASSFTDSTVIGRGWLALADPTTMTGTLTDTGPHPIRVTVGGSISGTAQITGDLQNYGGLVDPGSLNGAAEIGSLTVTGNYIQSVAGKLHLDLSSTGNDTLVVGGSATVAGTLETQNAIDYPPSYGEQRTALTAGSLAWSAGCTITNGRGSKIGHWKPLSTATQLTLVWRKGTHTTC